MTVFTPPVDDVPTVAVARTPRQTVSSEPEFSEPKPRLSRSWLWLFLAGCTLVTCTCFGSCAGLIGIQSNPIRKPFTAVDGRFTATFPGDPKTVMQTTQDGREVSGVEFLRTMPSEERYFVEYVVLTDEERKKDSQTLVRDSLKKWIADQDGSELEASDIDHKGLTASQLVGQISLLKGNVIARAIRDDDRIYIIGVSGGVTPWNDRVEHFLNDFTPTGSPDKDKRTEPPAKAKNKKNPFKGE